MENDHKHIDFLSNRFKEGIMKIPNVHANGDFVKGYPGI